MWEGYMTGTEVQEKSGRVKKKMNDGSWLGRNRYIAMQKLLHRDLEPGERVFHKNGDKSDDSPENLAVIKFTGIKIKLVTSRIVFDPKKQPNYKMWVPKWIKKEDRTLVAV